MHIINPELSQALTTALRECKDPYAQTYLRSIPESAEVGEQLCDSAEHGIRTQLLYVLSNMSHWKGETARETKMILKKYLIIKPLFCFSLF